MQVCQANSTFCENAAQLPNEQQAMPNSEDGVLFTHSQGFAASLDAMKQRGDTAMFEGVQESFDKVCEELSRT